MKSFALAILAHHSPERVVSLAKYLVRFRVPFVIHVDRKSLPEFEACFANENLDQLEGSWCWFSEYHCSWGEWSLVAAELSLYKKALSRFPEITHVHLMSVDDVFIGDLSRLEFFLQTNEAVDFVESIDIKTHGFSVGGGDYDRLKYFYFFNFTTQRFLFELSLKLQRLFGVSKGFKLLPLVRFGGQFKTLTSISATQLLDFCAKNKGIVNFFRYSWIPDESFVPTVLNILKENSGLETKTADPIVYRVFNSLGRPVRLNENHLAALNVDKLFFARKFFSASNSPVVSLPIIKANTKKEPSLSVELVLIFWTESSVMNPLNYSKSQDATFCGALEPRDDSLFDAFVDLNELGLSLSELSTWRKFRDQSGGVFPYVAEHVRTSKSRSISFVVNVKSFYRLKLENLIPVFPTKICLKLEDLSLVEMKLLLEDVKNTSVRVKYF